MLKNKIEKKSIKKKRTKTSQLVKHMTLVIRLG
jgi:hypothetical protein